MSKRSSLKQAADLVGVFKKARDTFMDAATDWNALRHRFLIRRGKQPKAEDDNTQDDPPVAL